MHSYELVELAAIISARGPALVNGADHISESGLEQYWTASKVRLDRWCRGLRNFATLSGDPKWRQFNWPRIRGVMEEIISGEMLTRVWAAVLCAHDRRHKLGEAEPIARSVLLGHLEARHRVLTLLLNTPGLELKAAAKLNRLYNLSEQWTDMLVGYLVGAGDVSEFAFDPARARDFARDFRDQGAHPGRRIVWPLILASLRASFLRETSAETPNADLNLRIASGILACFPSDLFDSTGQFQSLWLIRLHNSAADAQVLLDELLGVCPSGAKHRDSALARSIYRHRRP
ncbi:MAG: hypothetical protein IT426_21580 [Pirellulales bacterium]|nr:hypothetical protein [Pirellulales bacterium]